MTLLQIDYLIHSLLDEKNNIEKELDTLSSKFEEINYRIYVRRNRLIILQIFLLILGFFLPPLLFISLIIYIYNRSSTKKKKNLLKESKVGKNKKKLEEKIAEIENKIIDLDIKMENIIKTSTFQTYVVGTSFRQEKIELVIKHLENNFLVSPNETYNLSKKDLINLSKKDSSNSGYIREKIIWEFDPIVVELSLVPEPDNEYDKNAIAVCYKIDNHFIKLGYISKKENKKVHNMKIDEVIGIIRRGRYKLLDFPYYSDFDNEEDVSLIKYRKNYVIDLLIRQQE